MTKHKRPRHLAILVRHAEREKRWDKREDQHRMAGWKGKQRPNSQSAFDEKDKKDSFALTHALAGRLCDQLLMDKIAVKKIMHSKHHVARQTAEIYQRVIEEREVNKRVLGDRDVVEAQMLECVLLTPGCYSSKAIDRIKRQLTREPTNNAQPKRPASLAYVLIGHQPELTTIAHRWLRRWFRSALPFQTLPIDGSEAACLSLGRKPRLLWLITNKRQSLMDDLKDKIKSKYDVAKFFLGAFVVNTGLILNAGVWRTIGPSSTSIDKALIVFAIMAALVSLMFTAATLFSYDALQMPSTFWLERSDPANRLPRGLRKPPRWSINRPPSQAHVVLFYEMVHVWTAFFMPAIVAAFVAVGLVVIAMARRGVACWLETC